MTTKSFSCWQCAYFKADDPEHSKTGRCHRYAPHALDYFGFSGISIETPLIEKGDLYTHDDTDDTRLAVGTDGQILFADDAEPSGLKWGDPPSGTSPLMSKGDLYGRDVTSDARIPVGTDGQILVADSSDANGIKWEDPANFPLPYIIDGASEAESSTTSTDWQEKLTVSFTATLGVRYRIDYTFEINAYQEEDVDGRVEINNSLIICERHFKNFSPYSTLWGEGCGGFYITDSLSGAVTVDIDYKNGYGTGAKIIRRARLLVTRVDNATTAILAMAMKSKSPLLAPLSLLAPSSPAPTSLGKYSVIYDGETMWCGRFRKSPKTIPPLP